MTREELEADVQAFLAAGGTIEEVKPEISMAELDRKLKEYLDESDDDCNRLYDRDFLGTGSTGSILREG